MKLYNTALGILISKFNRRPFYIRYHLTHRCNYRCKFCGQNHGKAKRSDELSLQEIREVAKRVRAMGARHLVITGGEPFLRPDLPEIISTFKRYRFSIRIQTNGGPQVTEKLLDKCARAGLDDISVSIDTFNEDLQDEMCHARNVTSNALRTMLLSRKILPRGMSLANIVASQINFRQLPDMVRSFSASNIYTYITPVMIDTESDQKANRDYLFRGNDQSFIPSNIPRKLCQSVVSELITLRRHGGGLTNSTQYLKDYMNFLSEGQCHWKCEAGTLCLDILPDGNATICKEKPPFKNILSPDFMPYYQSREFFDHARKTALKCPGCFYGEYREPQYAVRHLGVLSQWTRDWYRTYRYGMGFQKQTR